MGINELIRANMGLVYKQLHKLHLQGDEEALSIGMEALYKAIITYSDKKNTKLSTYATVCIYNNLGSYIRSLNSQINKNTEFYERADGTSLIDTVESEYTADGNLWESFEYDQLVEIIQELLDEVTVPIQRRILDIWMESGYKAKQSSIAKEIGCSQSYVAKTINQFRKTLKEVLGYD